MELRDYYGNVAFRIVENRCYDINGTWMYVVNGDYICNSAGNWRYVIRGDRVYDVQGNWVYNIHQDLPQQQRDNIHAPVPGVQNRVASNPIPYPVAASGRPKKSSFKPIWVIVPIAVVILGIIVFTRGNNDDAAPETVVADAGADYGFEDYSIGDYPQEEQENTHDYTSEPTESAEYTEQPTESAGDETGVTAGAFSSLRMGMTIDEVQNIIGVAPMSETTSEIMGTTSTLITWSGAGFSSISVTFTNGYASLLMQMGLESTPQPGSHGITHESFAMIRNGMDVDEVQRIIGVLQSSITEVDVFGTSSTTILWSSSDFSSITVTFTNGSVTSTMQMGLEAPAQAVNNSTGVNMDSFVRITTGMSIDEVRGIMEESPMSETSTELFGITTTTAMWMAGMASIKITFSDGYVYSSFQSGL